VILGLHGLLGAAGRCCTAAEFCLKWSSPVFDVSTSIDCAISARAIIASCNTAGGGKSPGSNLLPEGDGQAVGGARVVVDEQTEPSSGVSEAERDHPAVAAKVQQENGETWLFGVAGE